MDGKALARARERLAQQKANNSALRDAREAEAYAKIPGLRSVDARLRALVGEVIAVTAAHGADVTDALAQVQARSLELCAEKAELLTANGYAADWLDEIVSCPRCRDTGYLKNGEMCACLKALYEEETARELSSVLKEGEESFADFSLDYYTGEARQCMELTYAAARQYAVGFDGESTNLLLQGGTGLGKTFLSGCIAQVVSAKGYSVVYETAQAAFGAFEEQKFSRDAETYAAASEKVRRILSRSTHIISGSYGAPTSFRDS